MDKLSKAAAVALVLVIVVQQLSAFPVVSVGLSRDLQSSVQSSIQSLQSPRRRARRTPLWRVLNSKPFGAYCQNNYECSTGLCSGGFCAKMHRTAIVFATN
uniref:Liver-expressed antimicrobial peptide 2 n=1 Tax=Neogobius melanostomus TaxID=47308 RepID=A0A8C6WQ48_9GOBI